MRVWEAISVALLLFALVAMAAMVRVAAFAMSDCFSATVASLP